MTKGRYDEKPSFKPLPASAIGREQLIRLKDRRQLGIDAKRSTLYRWATRGFRCRKTGKLLAKLETVYCGSRFTTKEAVLRFLRAINGIPETD